MPSPDHQERTEAATPKRREEARRRGQVARSGELDAAVVLLALLAAFSLGGGGIFQTLLEVIRVHLMKAGRVELLPANLPDLFLQSAWLFAKVAGPLLATALGAGMAINLLQTGFLYSPQAVTFNGSRLNPLAGIGRLVSTRNLVELLKVAAKLLLIGFVVYRTTVSEFDRFPSLADTDLAGLLAWQARLAFKLLLWVGGAHLILALLDYGWQRWLHEKNLRMTKEEVKEEMRQTEGDPRIKARVRSLQQEMSRHRMMSQVPRATVVIVNPVHLAVVLRYEREKMPAPVVIAKGRRFIAERIVQIAKERGIPIVEDPPLARALFYGVKVGQAIPVALYKAVAEILAYIYLLGRKGVTDEVA